MMQGNITVAMYNNALIQLRHLQRKKSLTKTDRQDLLNCLDITEKFLGEQHVPDRPKRLSAREYRLLWEQEVVTREKYERCIEALVKEKIGLDIINTFLQEP